MGMGTKKVEGTEAHMQVQRHSRVYDFPGRSRRAKWGTGTVNKPRARIIEGRLTSDLS